MYETSPAQPQVSSEARTPKRRVRFARYTLAATISFVMLPTLPSVREHVKDGASFISEAFGSSAPPPRVIGDDGATCYVDGNPDGLAENGGCPSSSDES